MAAVVFLGLAAGCRSSPRDVKVGEGADLGRYRRIGVLPFQGPKVEAREAARFVEELLRREGYATVAPEQMGPVFDSLRLQPGDELSLTNLMTLREQTRAEALVFGSLAPAKKRGGSRLAVLIIDGQSGELVVRGERDVPPKEKGGLQGAVEALLDSIREAMAKTSKEPSIESLEEP
ncbi:MAG: hypothetical protein HY553_10380 [Elusimicrobia bacterium]|nr:hypothetical protein [Elusimicrobiota bacterium]